MLLNYYYEIQIQSEYNGGQGTKHQGYISCKCDFCHFKNEWLEIKHTDNITIKIWICTLHVENYLSKCYIDFDVNVILI